MELQRILNFQIPKGTVLFVDSQCSTALSMLFSFDDLVPKKFTLICELEKDPASIKNLLERFISMLDFSHISFLISNPVRNYQKHIQIILDFDFDIFKIFSTIKNDDYSMLPKQVSSKANLIQYIYPVILPITDHFSIVPSLPSVLPDVITDVEKIDDKVEVVGQVLQQIMSQYSKSGGIRTFSYGDFSKKVSDFLESGRKGDNTESCFLLIDRTFCCAPLFTNEFSLLDRAASDGLTSVLQDSNLIKDELDGRLLLGLCKALGVDEKSNLTSLSKKWKSLSEKEKLEIGKKNPSIQYIFGYSSEKVDNPLNQKISNAQNSLLNGAEFDDIFASYSISLKPEDSVKIIGFQNCIHRINYQDYLSDVVSNSSSDKEDEYSQILENCYSGVDVDLSGASANYDDLLFLPQLLDFIFDKNAEVNSEIEAPSSGLINSFSIFKSKLSLKDFKKVYVFVIGGVSFRELALIRKLDKIKSTNTEFMLFSDTICSTINLFD